MGRAVRYHTSFKHDLAERVRWLRQHQPSEQRENLRTALAAFTERIPTFPGVGEEVERRGNRSYRRFMIGSTLPYIVWYYYDIADTRAPVWLVMLMHEDQDRERFGPDRFE
ncbi:MAG: type II toxin-antitoxin system RelE/ParE family toxin [Chloroflexi bacterium]|nr:type II toxin-antitoxin system RelE/ParE family toxin [Chloroflexota bacterium]